jgi:hypothetical protein
MSPPVLVSIWETSITGSRPLSRGASIIFTRVASTVLRFLSLYSYPVYAADSTA